MLHEFLEQNRPALIARCAAKGERRRRPGEPGPALKQAIGVFLGQLASSLAQSAHSGGEPVTTEIARSAADHGRALLEGGCTVDQLVHDYGDMCQAISELALERQAPIAVDEFRKLNGCLDEAIAAAASEFACRRDLIAGEQAARAVAERLGLLAHELRNHILAATLAVAAMRRGGVGLGGATGSVLDRSLVGLRSLVDRSLSEVRVSAGIPPQRCGMSVAEFIEELQVSAALEAQARGIELVVSPVDPGLSVEADREMLSSALRNLLQNAFKFTRPATTVTLRTLGSPDRVLIEVEDQGEGLAPGDGESIFAPFSQRGKDRTGVGLGLAISRRSVEANDGRLSVRSVPGKGSVFTVDLPRHGAAPQLPSASGQLSPA